MTLMDRYVKQGFSSTHVVDGLEAYAHSQMSVIEGICARASSAFCSMSGRSGARLALHAREQLVRSERDGLATHDGRGTSLTHAGGGDVELGRRVERTGGRHGGEKVQFVAGGGHGTKKGIRYGKVLARLISTVKC